MSRLWRAFHDGAGLTPGASVDLAREEAHHVRRVLRLATGDALALFDGRGGEWAGTIESCDRDAVTVRLGAPRTVPVEAPLDVTLFQGRARPERFEWVVQKATEIGVRSIVSLDCDRSDGRPLDERRRTRLRRMTIEACKQCGRRRLPELSAATELPGAVDGTPALLLDTAAAPALGGLDLPRPEAVWLAVGPEGGFSDAERETALGAGWQPVGLGPRILRTETAGIVAVALILHRWADLGPEPENPGFRASR